MNPISILAMTLFTLLSTSSVFAAGSCDLSSQWHTVDQLGANHKYSQLYGMASNNGVTVAAGYATGAASTSANRWFVRMTKTGGDTWQTIEDGVAGFQESFAYAAAIDSHGAIYIAGSVFPGGAANNHWLVRKSTDFGMHWKTVDDVTDTPANSRIEPHAMAIDAKDRIYVSGYDQQANRNSWVTRMSGNGGATWTTVDYFQKVAGRDASAQGVAAAGNGKLVVAGYSQDALNHQAWTVRSSNDAGVTWSTVDLYDFNSSGLGTAQSVAIDGDGNVSVAGYASGVPTSYHWLVRSSKLSNLTSWQLVDDFTLNGQSTAALGLAFTGDGRLFVTGTTFFSSQSSYLTREGDSAAGPFSQSDNFSAGPSFIGGQGGFAATVDAFGEVFTGGNVITSSNIAWTVRELRCVGSGKGK